MIAYEIASHEDLAFLRVVLKREPEGLLGIAARDQAGNPQVILNHPLVEREHIARNEKAKTVEHYEQPARAHFEPRPTFIWLVDPVLSEKISALEFAGGVKALEDWLGANSARTQRYLAEHKIYADFRWAFLSQAERLALAGSLQEKVLKESGIGGMGEIKTPAVKCLHLQMAWALAYPQAVAAEWLAEKVG